MAPLGLGQVGNCKNCLCEPPKPTSDTKPIDFMGVQRPLTRELKDASKPFLSRVVLQTMTDASRQGWNGKEFATVATGTTPFGGLQYTQFFMARMYDNAHYVDVVDVANENYSSGPISNRMRYVPGAGTSVSSTAFAASVDFVRIAGGYCVIGYMNFSERPHRAFTPVILFLPDGECEFHPIVYGNYNKNGPQTPNGDMSPVSRTGNIQLGRPIFKSNEEIYWQWQVTWDRGVGQVNGVFCYENGEFTVVDDAEDQYPSAYNEHIEWWDRRRLVRDLTRYMGLKTVQHNHTSMYVNAIINSGTWPIAEIGSPETTYRTADGQYVWMHGRKMELSTGNLVEIRSQENYYPLTTPGERWFLSFVRTSSTIAASWVNTYSSPEFKPIADEVPVEAGVNLDMRIISPEDYAKTQYGDQWTPGGRFPIEAVGTPVDTLLPPFFQHQMQSYNDPIFASTGTGRPDAILSRVDIPEVVREDPLARNCYKNGKVLLRLCVTERYRAVQGSLDYGRRNTTSYWFYDGVMVYRAPTVFWTMEYNSPSIIPSFINADVADALQGRANDVFLRTHYFRTTMANASGQTYTQAMAYDSEDDSQGRFILPILTPQIPSLDVPSILKNTSVIFPQYIASNDDHEIPIIFATTGEEYVSRTHITGLPKLEIPDGWDTKYGVSYDGGRNFDFNTISTYEECFNDIEQYNMSLTKIETYDKSCHGCGPPARNRGDDYTRRHA